MASLLYRAGIVDMRSARYRKEGDVLPGAAAATAQEAATGEAEMAAES